MYFLSNSSIYLYYECKRCFWLQFRKGLKRPSGIFSGMPIVVDSLMKAHCDTFRRTDKMPPHMTKVPGKLAGPLQMTAAGNIKMLVNLPNKKQVQLIAKLDELAEVKPGVYAPVDHKTTGSPDAKIYPGYQRQMDIYSYAVSHGLVLKTSGKGYFIYYHPVKSKDGEIPVAFNSYVKVVDTDEVGVPKMLMEIVDYLDQKEPDDPSPECGFCNYVTDRIQLEDDLEEIQDGK